MKGLYAFLLTLGVMSLALTGCGPKYPDCEGDDHCKEHNEFCVDGKCKQCRTDDNCNAMDKCLVCGPTGACVTRTGCCHSDLDCPGGKCWMEGDLGTCGGLCRGDADCPNGLECRGGQCMAKPVAKPENCAKPIYFDFNEYVLTSAAKSQLKANIECMKGTGFSYRVEGNCDERGTEEYNLALGTRRAEAAKKFLVNAGFNKGLLSTKSWGEDNPTCRDSGESCWGQNRRDEFIPAE
jgi:peptidoglycan-associated lipoprotein